MIQRIQSVLLFFAAAAVFGLFKLPFGSSGDAIANSALFNDGVFNIQDHVGLLGLFCGAGALAFIAIFLFNNRKTQLTLSRISIIFAAFAMRFINKDEKLVKSMDRLR